MQYSSSYSKLTRLSNFFGRLSEFGLNLIFTLNSVSNFYFSHVVNFIIMLKRGFLGKIIV